MHILFVCTGNICRSPTAERLTTAFAHENDIAHVRASSAGTHAVIGHPVHPNAAVVLGQLGGSSDGFAARQLTHRVVSDVDLVLTMSTRHRDAVLELAPRLLRRAFTLTEASYLVSTGGADGLDGMADLRSTVPREVPSEVPDPIGRDYEVFEQVGSFIAEQLEPIFELVRRSPAGAR